MAKTFAIAIDGPAGAGKSTIAKALAKELGFRYVDTGAIYRTVAYFLDLLGVSPKDVDGVERYIDELTIEIEYDEDGKQHMIMNGMDVTGEIRTQDISQKASLVSAHAVVRDMLLVALFYAVFTPASTWLGNCLESAGVHDWLVQLIIMCSNLVTEYLFQKFVVYKEKAE